jgi:hypothetical protein
MGATLTRHQRASSDVADLLISECDFGWRDARSGVVDELAHALCFRALSGNQAHVAPDMIAMTQSRQLGFIAVRVFFQALNALFD